MDVFPDLEKWQTKCTSYLLRIHPDHCSKPNSEEATTKLLEYKTAIKKGIEHIDDAGIVTYTPKTITISSNNIPALRKSNLNFNHIVAGTSKHWRKYMPLGCIFENDKLVFKLEHRAIPLSSLGTIDQVHVNWIASRILEFAGFLNQQGYVHSGINPDSIYVVPETHGVLFTTFYHLEPLNEPLHTISARYLHFYPDITFQAKEAIPEIDLELIKRTAAFLLGDLSGTGIKFLKTHNRAYIDWLLRYETDTLDSYKLYRMMLKQEFPKKFYPFNK